MRLTELKQKSDDELLEELFVSDPQGNEAEQIRMILFVRKINDLAGSITQASKAGRTLAWAVGAATIVGSIIAVLQFIRICY